MQMWSTTQNCDCKLRDVPAMNYFSIDKYPRGETIIRDPSIFQKYYKLPDKTNQTMVAPTDESKYNCVATGNIGRINPNNTLTIIDKSTNVFKLEQIKEYVARNLGNVDFCCFVCFVNSSHVIVVTTLL